MPHTWKLKPIPTKLKILLGFGTIDTEIDKLLDVAIKVLKNKHSESEVAIKDFFPYGLKDYVLALKNDCFYVRVTRTPPDEEIINKLKCPLERRGYKASECHYEGGWGKQVRF